MNLNPFQGIRGKIVWLFFASFILTVLAVGATFLAIVFLFNLNVRPVQILIDFLYYSIGALPVVALYGVMVFIFFVVMLSRKSIRYLVHITESVEELANGKLDKRIPVMSKDELGELADHINRMARKINASLEEERRAVQAKNELITNVSHDLRTPLTSIMGYLRLIQEDRYKDEVELRYYVDIAYNKSRRLDRLVHDLFEYTRMNYGQPPIAQQEINLVELIGQVAAEHVMLLKDSNMEIHLNTQEEKMRIKGDGDKLMRAFENLISNAVKYGKDGGRVDLIVQRIERGAAVKVINYGPQIPREHLPHLFERFYRVDKSRSDATGGTGLGLAIVKSIVELHEGNISVSSDSNRTVFEVRLPLL